MRNPIKLPSAGGGHAIRRDTMVGTALLLLVESGLLGAAASMVGISAEADELEQHRTGEEGARKARPLSASKPLPDTHVDMAGNPVAGTSESSDDEDFSPVDFARIGVGGVHRPREIGNPAAGHADLGGVAGLPFDPAGHAVARPPAYDGSAGGPSGSRSEPEDKPAAPPSRPDAQETNVLLGTDENDVIQGTEDSDYIFGRDGPDLLIGRGGNDRLLAGKGDDVLSGGEGNDMLVGDKGDDRMTGGAGADSFLFRSGFGHDTITDFKAGGELDVIEVAKAEFADFAALSHNLSATDLGVMLSLHDGSTLTLSHVTLASLTASDFRFEV